MTVRYSGADMWNGMAVWRKGEFVLRGNVSTANDGEQFLLVAGYINSRLYYVEDLKFIYNILMGEEL